MPGSFQTTLLPSAGDPVAPSGVVRHTLSPITITDAAFTICIYRVAKKQHIILLSISLLNIDRFS